MKQKDGKTWERICSKGKDEMMDNALAYSGI